MNEFDLNKLVAEIIASNFSSISDSAKSVFRKLDQKIKMKMEHTFKEYIEYLYKKNSRVKMLPYKNEPQDIYDFYIPLDVKCAEKLIRDVDFINMANFTNTLVTGLPGSGKSTLMKHLLLCSLKKSKKIPIYIEMKHYNGMEFIEFIFNFIKSCGFSLEYDLFISMFRNGNFNIFIDGFDEIQNEFYQKCSEEIIEIALKYYKNIFIISSRPNIKFGAWSSFYEFDLLPLTKEKSISLIKKLKHSEKIKSKFIQNIEENEYIIPDIFITNPLLLTLALTIYEQTNDVPDKIHSFYSAIYDTLFFKHDTSKLSFQRKTFSNLNKDEFEKVLSCFAISIHLSEIETFDEYTLNNHLENASRLSEINFDRTAYKKDLTESLFILVRDEYNYTFIHRSFQEYFTARYCCIFLNNNETEVLKKIASIDMDTQTLDFIFSMNKYLLISKLIIPTLEELKTKSGFNSLPKEKATYNFFKLIYETIHLENGHWTMTYATNYEIILELLNNYYHNYFGKVIDISDFLIDNFETLIISTEHSNERSPEFLKLSTFNVNYASFEYITSLFSLLDSLKSQVNKNKMSIEQLLLG